MSDLAAAVGALVARLDKEVARADGPRTTRVGGYNLAGAELEKVLKLAAATTCRSQGTSLDAELARARVPRGAGSYLRVLTEAGGHQSSDAVIRSLANDARTRQTSRLQRLVDLRNEVAHRPDAVDAGAAKRLMKSVADWLRPLVSER